MATKKVKKVVKVENSTTKPVAKKKVCSKKKVVAKALPAKKVCCEAKTEIVENNKSYVVIDYPVENDIISGNAYVLRIGASADGYVEVSFNNGEWQLCRFASGYWWYDWTYFKSGNYTIKVRIVDANGKVVKVSDVRKCKVA